MPVGCSQCNQSPTPRGLVVSAEKCGCVCAQRIRATVSLLRAMSKRPVGGYHGHQTHA